MICLRSWAAAAAVAHVYLSPARGVSDESRAARRIARKHRNVLIIPRELQYCYYSYAHSSSSVRER